MKELDPSPTLPLAGEGVKTPQRVHRSNTCCHMTVPQSNSYNDKTVSKLISSTGQEGGSEGVTSKTAQSKPSPQPKIFNNPQQKKFRRQLRKNPTEPEQRLWHKLRSQQLGTKFRRQQGIGQYVADFYCAEFAMVIEIDGDSHYLDNVQHYDKKREKFMADLGLTTLRFLNSDIMDNIDGVLVVVVDKLEELHVSRKLNR